MSQNNHLIVALVVLCAICIGVAAYALAGGTPVPGSAPVTLTVMMPYDQSISTAMTKLAGEYGKDHNTQINLITVKGRQALVREITSANSSADLVVIENAYPMYNLSGLKTLETEGLVDSSTYLCSADAVLVVQPDSGISNLPDIAGKQVAVVDMVNYHGPGGCLANYIVADANITVVPVLESGIPQVYNAVATSSADATCIWESEFVEQQTKTGSNLIAVPLPQYAMDNYLVLLKNSGNPTEAAAFRDYVIAHKDEFSG